MFVLFPFGGAKYIHILLISKSQPKNILLFPLLVKEGQSIITRVVAEKKVRQHLSSVMFRIIVLHISVWISFCIFSSIQLVKYVVDNNTAIRFQLKLIKWREGTKNGQTINYLPVKSPRVTNFLGSHHGNVKKSV